MITVIIMINMILMTTMIIINHQLGKPERKELKQEE